MLVHILLLAGAVVLAPPADKEKEDLADKLVKGEQAAPGDVAELVVQWMGEVDDRLSSDFDPGRETQAQQAKILDALDDLIKSARPSKSKGGGGQDDGQNDRRQNPKDAQRAEDQSKNKGRPGGDVAGETEASKVTPADAEVEGGRFRESRRGWGHLPSRDREEVLQGIQDEVVERYRQMIDDYYRALAEMEERNK